MQINGYHLEAPLGEDELGLSYAGRAAGGLAQVAILVLHAHLCGEPHTDRRLRALCEVLRGTPLQGVPLIRQAGRLDSGRVYLVTDRPTGDPLSALLLMRGGRLPYDEARPLLVALCRILAQGQERGLLHLRLRPGCILVNGVVPTVRHLGLVPALGMAGAQLALVRTAYDPPGPRGTDPPASVDGPDGRVDVYALGAILHEVLVGQPPGDGALRGLNARAPELVAELVRDMLAADPAARPTMGEVLQGLDPPAIADDEEDTPPGGSADDEARQMAIAPTLAPAQQGGDWGAGGGSPGPAGRGGWSAAESSLFDGPTVVGDVVSPDQVVMADDAEADDVSDDEVALREAPDGDTGPGGPGAPAAEGDPTAPGAVTVTGAGSAAAAAAEINLTIDIIADDLVEEVAADDDPATGRTALGAPAGEAGPPSLSAKQTAPQQRGAVTRPSAGPGMSPAGTPLGLVGNYRVMSKIGEGGMGVVYAAVHQKIGRWAAIKVLHPRFARSQEFATRFLNEARAVNIVQHPGMVEIFEFGRLGDGSLYIIMELLEGESLRVRLHNRGRLKEPDALRLAVQMARALTTAHKKDIVHRDLKPENVMLIADPVSPGQERVKILDFGIAKVAEGRDPNTGLETPSLKTDSRQAMGTPRYMAPEQYGGAEVDDRADVFSLGVMLFEMLAGKTPFGKSSLSILSAPIPSVRQVEPGVSPAMEALVGRMLAQGAKDRPSMQQVADELSRMLALLEEARRPKLSLRALALVAAVAGLVLVPAIYFTVRYATRGNQHPVVDLGALRTRALAVFEAGVRAPDPVLRSQALGSLGQCRDLRLLPLVQPLLQDPDLRVVSQAAEWLGQLGAAEAVPDLLAAADRVRSTPTLVPVAGALAFLQHPRGAALLRDGLQGPDEGARLRAALLLAERGDPEVPALLRQWLKRRNLPADTQVQLLSALALLGDEQAQADLQGLWTQERHSLMGISVAASLSRLGDERARAFLQEQARRSGPQRLLAARLLSDLGDPAGFGLFEEVFPDPKQTPPARLLAAEGLAACGKREGALALATALPGGRRGLLGLSGAAPEADPALREAAAGGILQIAGSDAGQLAEQSLGWARSALGHASWSARQSAVRILGEAAAPDTETVPLLTQALKDEQKEVRRTAALALGKRRAREALGALREALSDADEDVRRAAMGSIAKVAAALQERQARDGGGAADEISAVIARLRELHQGGAPPDRIVSAGTLLLLGDRSGMDTLRGGLQAPLPLWRRLAVEMVGPDDDELLAGVLHDPDRAVRFSAARRLAAQGSKLGGAVLTEVLGEGGAEGLLAYIILKKQGEAVTPPAGLYGLLVSAPLETRLQVLDATQDLPGAEAVPLLWRAAADPAAAVRWRLCELAAVLAQGRQAKTAGTDSPAGSAKARALLRMLVTDQDVGVRARASAFLAQLPPEAAARQEPPQQAPVDAGAPPDLLVADAGADGGADLGPAGDRYAHLEVQGEERVRFQVDRQAAKALPARVLQVEPGRHRIQFLGGTVEVTVAAGETRAVRIPTTQAEQLLSDGAAALEQRDYRRAQQLLDRAQLVLARGAAQGGLQAALYGSRGRLYEAQGLWVESITEFNKLLKLPAAQRKPEQGELAREALQRLARRVGRIQVYKEVDGQCQMTEQWMPTGEHMVDLGGGRSQMVRVGEGATAVVRLCR